MGEIAMGSVPVALLAGGLATRLRPITERIPKAMVEVGGRPFIDHQVELLRANGVREVVVCAGHMGEQIEEHLGDGERFGVRVRYSHDGGALLGTAGALRRALPMLGERFWVMYGDSYMEIDYEAVLGAYRERGAPALMTVIRNEGRWDRSNALYEGGRLLRYDKRQPSATMRHIDYGVGLLESRLIEVLPEGVFVDLADVYRALVEEGLMTAYVVSRRFYEIGTPAGLEETRAYLAR